MRFSTWSGLWQCDRHVGQPGTSAWQGKSRHAVATLYDAKWPSVANMTRHGREVGKRSAAYRIPPHTCFHSLLLHQ